MTKLEHAQAPNNKENHLVKRFVAGGALVAAAIAGGMYEAGEFDRADKAEATSSLDYHSPSTTHAEAPAAGLGSANRNNTHLSKNEILTLKDPSDAQSVAPADLVAAFGSSFEGWREQVYTTISPIMSADQAAVLNKNTLPSNNQLESWSDQQVLNVIAVDIADATIQETQQEGRVMLPAVLDAHSHGFQSVYNGIQGGKAPSPTLQVYAANGKPYPKPKGEFMGTTDLSPNARLIFGTYEHSGTGNDADSTPTVGILVDIEKGSDGTSKMWRKLDWWDANDPAFIAAYTSIR